MKMIYFRSVKKKKLYSAKKGEGAKRYPVNTYMCETTARG